jgi:predicted ArsR family transcriptional regulator
MTTTRDQILRQVKARGHVTIAELAAAIGISPVSVRHHTSALQAEGLLRSVEVRRGVGRPVFAYSLTDAAQERFPARYLQLSERLLDELKASLPPQALEAIFARMAEGIAADFARKVEGKPLEEKMELLVEMLGEEGFMARWNKTGETISLTEYNCPYIRIGQRHPEVCVIDRTVISQVLSADVEKTTCVLDGAERCVFVIKPQRSSDNVTLSEK